jgi:hypothetical protein
MLWERFVMLMGRIVRVLYFVGTNSIRTIVESKRMNAIHPYF